MSGAPLPAVRIVFFGSGSPVSTAALRALAERFRIVAVVVPSAGRVLGARSLARALLRWQARQPLVGLARDLGTPVLRYARLVPGLEGRLRRLEPDLFCVATFPWLLEPSLLALPRGGAIGIHPSLLPRHRGPEPLFWTYFDDDREGGVSVFWLDAGEDRGDVIRQQAIPLARGRSVVDLYHDVARAGADLLVRAVEDVAAGRAARIPQDETRATREPAPKAGSWRIDFSSWGSERTWHFLRGLAASRWPLLTGPDGRPIAHGPPQGFALDAHDRIPGTVERLASGWRVFCRDGSVDLDAPDPVRRLLVGARRIVGRPRTVG